MNNLAMRKILNVGVLTVAMIGCVDPDVGSLHSKSEPLERKPSSTPLPYDEILGNATTVGCSASWDGACEAGWTGVGQRGSIELVNAVAEPDEFGIRMMPGSAGTNGVTRTFKVNPGKVLEWKTPMIPVDGAVTAVLRVAYANAAGATIATVTDTQPVTHSMLFTRWFANPALATSASVTIGAIGGDGDSELVVSEAGFFGAGGLGGCTWPGLEIEHPKNDCEDCPACDISCPEGDLVQNCEIDPDTCAVISSECYCEGGDEFQTQSAWF